MLISIPPYFMSNFETQATFVRTVKFLKTRNRNTPLSRFAWEKKNKLSIQLERAIINFIFTTVKFTFLPWRKEDRFERRGKTKAKAWEHVMSRHVSQELAREMVSFNIITHLAGQTYVGHGCKWNFAGPQIYLQPAKIKSQHLGVSLKFLVCIAYED